MLPCQTLLHAYRHTYVNRNNWKKYYDRYEKLLLKLLFFCSLMIKQWLLRRLVSFVVRLWVVETNFWTFLIFNKIRRNFNKTQRNRSKANSKKIIKLNEAIIEGDQNQLIKIDQILLSQIPAPLLATSP